MYGQQSFSPRVTTGWTRGCTFEPAEPLGVTIQKQTTDAGPTVYFGSASWITLRGFRLNGLQRQCGHEGRCPYGYSVISESSGTPSSHISILDNEIDEGMQLGGGSMIMLFKAQHWKISGNVLGPSCCGYAADSSPAGITIGKPTSGPNSCTTEACNVDIDHNVFQYTALRLAIDWPTARWHSSPEPSCRDATRCHVDSIHIGGLRGGSVDYNQFLGDECTGIYLESGGFNGNDNRDVDVIGNTWTHFSDHCDGALYLKCTGAANGCGGTFNIGFNSGNDEMILGTGWAGAEKGTIVNIYGNYTYLFMADASGNNAGCMTGTTGQVTVAYQYNAWLGSMGGGGNTPGPCGATDSTNVRTPGWVNPAGAPGVGLDMQLRSKSGRAIGFVPCASLTIGAGCPIGTDAFGHEWPQGRANAGADQAPA